MGPSVDTHTSKKIWQAPALHRDTLPSRSELAFHSTKDVEYRHAVHRTEAWYELFYDLIFVATAIQIGEITHYDISLHGIFQSGLLFAVMRATWDQLMFYQVCVYHLPVLLIDIGHIIYLL